MAVEPLGSWHSREYAEQWAGQDVLARMLEPAQRISTALVSDVGTEVRHVVDLGSGPGGYLARFLNAFPDAEGTWIDSSEAMRELANEQLAPFGERVSYVLAEIEALPELDLAQAEVVISSRVLHHFSPQALQRTYREVHDRLAPGGFFFNLDHVGVVGGWEPRYRRVRDQLTGPRTTPLKPHRHAFPLQPVEQHVAWLQAAGFEEVDVPWRVLYTALTVARRPAA